MISPSLQPYKQGLNLIDSWKIRNHEFIGYQTFYEQSNNIDFNGNENSEIDRDGSFHVDALSAFVLSADMTPYYSHISKNFAVSGITDKIDAQLSAFRPDIIALSGQHIFNYQVDQYNNHYMLYKESDSSVATGTLWMRFRNHPLPFPLCSDAESASAYELQQLYCRGGMGFELNSMFNGGALDFGFYDNIIWVAGAIGERVYPFLTEDDDELMTEDEIALETDDNEYAEKLLVFQNDYIYFPLTTDPGPSDETVFSVVFKGSQYPQEVPNLDEYANFVGVYAYEPYLVFVHVISAPEDNSVMFKFKHYDKYQYKFVDIPTDAVTVSDPNIQPLHEPLNEAMRKLWHLASSENWVHIAYEGNNSLSGEFANSIVTIDIDKSTLDGSTAVVNEWTNFLDYSV